MTVAPHRPHPSTPAASEAAADGAGDAELLPLRLVHRVMVRDVRRLAGLADGLAAGTEAVPARRALAVGDWVERVCAEIAHHHDGEESLLWPVLERHAGPAVDLSGLRDDHAALRPLLGQVRRGARAVVAALLQRPAAVATVADFRRMRELAGDLQDLAELLAEHLADSERELGEVLAEVPAPAWRRAERALRAGAPDPAFTGARVLDAASSDEAAALRRVSGARPRMAMRAATVTLRRRERQVFGCGA